MPCLTNCAAAGIETHSNGTCPPITSVTAGPPPLYGMCVICVPVRTFSSSPARWPGDPLPTEANDRLSGLALASAISSATFATGSCGFATRICGSDATVPTGSKSFTVLNGSFG